MSKQRYQLPFSSPHGATGRRQNKRTTRWQRLLGIEALEGRRLLAIDLISAAAPDLVALDQSGNGSSYAQRISADGRYVVFASDASNLVAGDDNFSSDVFLRDRLLGTTTLVSVNSAGTGSGNSGSFNPVISANGSTVAFMSGASDLDPSDTDAGFDIFIWNAADGVRLVSVNSDGTGSGSSDSRYPVISADGSTVAFSSSASNLDPIDTDTRDDIFVWDAAAGVRLVSVNNAGTGSGNGYSVNPVISADGSTIAFASSSSNLDPIDTDTVFDIFIWDASAGVRLVSVNRAGTGSGNLNSLNPVISADGSTVAFRSIASDLAPVAWYTGFNIYVWDASAGVRLVSANSAGTGGGNNWSFNPVISADGSTVAFDSNASNLDPADTDIGSDIFVWNAAAGVRLVSTSSAGTGSGNSSVNPVVSADGSTIAFQSNSSNLDPADTDTGSDIFVWHAIAGVRLVSADSAGSGSGNSDSFDPVISADGSTVAFLSSANNLVEHDYNGKLDVFARDLANANVDMISESDPNLVNSASGNGRSRFQRISANGRYIVFESEASNLVAGDDNFTTDVFLRDRLLGTTTLVSANSAGTGSGNNSSSNPVISADGSTVVFQSNASDLDAADTDTGTDVFIWDAVAGVRLVSANSTGTASGNAASFSPVISADGSTVAFYSLASNLDPADTDTNYDIFVWDAAVGVRLVSANSAGTASGNAASFSPVISADGSTVAFYSFASNLDPADTDTGSDIFVWDAAAGVRLVSADSAGTGSGNAPSSSPVISADGSTVAFQSNASNLDPADTDTATDIFVWDVAAGVRLVSVNSSGTGSGNGFSTTPAISADGSAVAFRSSSSDLDLADTDTYYDIFVWDAAAGVRLVSADSGGTGSGNSNSFDPAISADGSTVTFESRASNLDPADTDTGYDIFVWNTASGVRLVSANSAGTGSGNGSSSRPVISADGSTVAFSSFASDLVENDNNNTLDVFAAALNTPPTADDATFELAENSPHGTIVGMVSTTDPDGDTLTYSITGGDGQAAFAIDAATGVISVADAMLLDYEAYATPVFTLEVLVDDGNGGSNAALVTINLLNQASISGDVYVDINQNGLREANEPGIDGVTIELRDAAGDPVLDAFGEAIKAITSNGGYYLFEDLDPADYQLHQLQPTGVDDGEESLGSLGGTIVANDVMQLALQRMDAFDYAFAELGQQVGSGDSAGIGFWQNKHGQALIADGGTALAGWLSNNFANVFGNSLASATGQDVADFYRDQLFRQKGVKSLGPAKVDAQFMAVALATYFTSSQLAGSTASSYGFNVTDTGIGSKVVDVGSNGAAFGLLDGDPTTLTIMQLLQATNSMTDRDNLIAGHATIYDRNGDGQIDSEEAALRDMAHNVFAGINESGDI